VAKKSNDELDDKVIKIVLMCQSITYRAVIELSSSFSGLSSIKLDFKLLICGFPEPMQRHKKNAPLCTEYASFMYSRSQKKEQNKDNFILA
jgi:hypothetical protein